jgi:hypothetical protein
MKDRSQKQCEKESTKDLETGEENSFDLSAA